MWFSDLTVVLASNSPRRKRLLESMDFTVETIKSNSTNEIYPTDLAISLIPEYLSKKKMHTLQYKKPLKNKILLTADTMVFLNNKPLGKPQNKDEAYCMLKNLSNKEHLVITGCCLKSVYAEKTFSDHTFVKFSSLNDSEILYYIEHYKPFDKAGSYGIQEWLGLTKIKAIRGSFYNVMGLPCEKLYLHLQDLISPL
ncbi:MAG: Maf family nucleotide pyrophosphatase [Bacteroidales bacterium]|jgi:septum formation protein|nr:Maf family nucleotide pyrophosphatase [Bacteroidales bacterium]